MARINLNSPDSKLRRAWAQRTTPRLALAFIVAVIIILVFGTHVDKLHRPSAEQLDSSNARRFAPRSSSREVLVEPRHDKDEKAKVETLRLSLENRDVDRLIIIGDVHGMFTALKELLEKVGYDKDNKNNKNHVILAGDMITAGPENRQVLDLARENDFSAIMGNHEYQLLVAFDNYKGDSDSAGESDLKSYTTAYSEAFLDNPDPSKLKKGIKSDLKVAETLGDINLKWIRGLPHILRLPQSNFVVAHAGLMPGVELEDQLMLTVLNVEKLVKEGKTFTPSTTGEGENWFKVWNKEEGGKDPKDRTTVIYGHDQSEGLQWHPEQNSLGIDTGCKKGKELTAVILERNEKPRYESVGCEKIEKSKGRRAHLPRRSTF
ncbi:Uu.00g045140.m01.CDS01 [Anthostomella pinea]|uniref:Uu.00g045140.m01.CDS01 n=1 Tax=Anthostomella pinea TaxID=933095 RepID=A0AAI8YEA3_9PEZI|nr:Uu.00g045140.m01.CDS01 [Anthostomella pinea]